MVPLLIDVKIWEKNVVLTVDLVLSSIDASTEENLGKKGHKSGMKIQFRIAAKAAEHIDMDDAVDMFKGVGKGLGKKVDIDVHLIG